VYDVTRRNTYEKINNWHEEIKKNTDQISMILVGNKIDLVDDREVTPEEGKELAEKLNLSYIETSAKTGENIEDAFRMLALQLIKKDIKGIEV
jgi:Ras-related protein Rab-1A